MSEANEFVPLPAAAGTSGAAVPPLAAAAAAAVVKKKRAPAKAKVAKPEPETCMICMGDYNNSTRKRAECQHCHTAFCRTCLQTYLLDAGMVPLCMSPECRLPMSDEFIEANTSTTWRLKDLKKAREQFILDLQKARLPETLPIAENIKAAERYMAHYQEAVIKPLQEKLANHWYSVQMAALEAEEVTQTQKYWDRDLNLHTVKGCERYGEYMEWLKEETLRLQKKTALKAALDTEGETIKQGYLKQALEVGKKRGENGKAIRKLPKTDPESAETRKLRGELQKKDRELGAEWHRLKELSKTAPPNTFHKMVKDLSRAPMDRVYRLARLAIDSFGRTQFHAGAQQPGVEVPKEDRKAFVRACPAADCRGFLSTAWKCGLCETWVCPDCHEIKKGKDDESHTCKPESIETAKMLAKEAKPCPKCAAQICKIDGCDQMWCTQCHTAFSWRTGKAVSDGQWVHNPHYYEWARRNGVTIARTPGDPGPGGGRAGVDPCGGFVEWTTLVTAGVRPVLLNINYSGQNTNGIASYTGNALTGPERRSIIAQDLACVALQYFHQQVSDMRWRYHRRPEILTTDDIHRDLRVRYLIGAISEEELKIALQRKDKEKRKKKADWDIHNMYVTAANDIFQILLANMRKTMPRTSSVWDALKALLELQHYTNQILIANEKIYNNTFHVILDPITQHRRMQPTGMIIVEWWQRLMADKEAKPDVALETLAQDGYLLSLIPNA
jgi:hypothetical protein